MVLFSSNTKREKSINFPGGECHVILDPEEIKENVEVVAYLYNSDDIMRLILTIDAIRRINAEVYIDLTLPYFPYARQDRVCNVGEALGVKVMADMVNALRCRHVTLYDPHSDVTAALVNNAKIISMAEIIADHALSYFIKNKELLLVSPDAGAEKKVRQVAKILSSSDQQMEIIYASKTRNVLTGKITSTALYGEVEGRDVIILDDICDGGATFIILAKLLKNKGAKDVYLYVTHGIFSRGLACFQDHFTHIYCYHSFLQGDAIDTRFLTIIGEETHAN